MEMLAAPCPPTLPATRCLPPSCSTVEDCRRSFHEILPYLLPPSRSSTEQPA